MNEKVPDVWSDVLTKCDAELANNKLFHISWDVCSCKGLPLINERPSTVYSTMLLLLCKDRIIPSVF